MRCPDDGYRLGYSGYDYLALKALSKKGVVYAVGPQVGTGKESDVFTCTADDESGKQLILKIHRLGRISFRTVKQNRDYLQGRKTASWMYLSQLAAHKEFTFMKVPPRCPQAQF
jgi:RIO kinase 2